MQSYPAHKLLSSRLATLSTRERESEREREMEGGRVKGRELHKFSKWIIIYMYLIMYGTEMAYGRVESLTHAKYRRVVIDVKNIHSQSGSG